MAFLDQHKLAIYVDDTITPDALDFRKRVQLAMYKVAILIQGEAMASMTPQQWRKRASLSSQVLGIDASILLDTFSLGVVTNAAITSVSTDADIEFQVTAIWDDVAGVTGQDIA